MGFGDLFLEPLRLDVPEQHQENRRYRLEQRESVLVLWEHKPREDWRPQYAFSLQPHEIDEFADMCGFHQTSPESHFTRNTVCTLATPTGRVTLSGNRLIISEPSGREERVLGSDDEIAEVLRDRFGIRVE